MCDVGYDIPKMMAECRNGRKQRGLGLVRGSKKFSVGKAEGMRGDVASLVATTLPSNHFHAKEILTKLRLC